MLELLFALDDTLLILGKAQDDTQLTPTGKILFSDREIAEKILRAYYEDGIVPTGLTEEFVYGSWSESDYVLRNTWDFGSATRTWRYQG